MRIICERENKQGIKHKHVLGRSSPAQHRWCINTSQEAGRVHQMDWGNAKNGTRRDWKREIVASTDESLGLPPIDEVKLYVVELYFKHEIIHIYHVTEDIMDAWNSNNRFHTLEEAREGLKAKIMKKTRFKNHPMIAEVDEIECIEMNISNSRLHFFFDEYLKKEVCF